MSDKREVVTIKRRQFLTGAGGALLALPFLPSLMPRSARAATGRPKNFIAFASPHGGAYFRSSFPADSMLTESTQYGGRTVRRGALTPTISGSTASLSPVLSAPASKLTARLIGKMNVIAGLDIPWYIAHHTGGHLGNSQANDGNGGALPDTLAIPTIDQVMAYSPSFYPNLGSVLKRSLQFGSQQFNRAMSFTWSNPTARTGGIVPLHPTNNTLQAFDSVFVPPPSGPPQPMRTPVVDRVFESYQRLVKSNRRLSTSDRKRIEEHIARLAEIQRQAGVTVSCSGVARPAQNASSFWGSGPSGLSNAASAFKLTNDVIVAALLCGTCRVVTVSGVDQNVALFSGYVGDWHQAVAHVAGAGNASDTATINAEIALRQSYQQFFEAAFLDLIAKLDVDNGTGGSLLDDTLVVWTQESGHVTHDAYSIPVVTAGSAGGALRTGSYIDYRNLAISTPVGAAGGADRYNPGLLWNQWLGAALQAVGVPRSEYEVPLYQPMRPTGSGTSGYGWWKYESASYFTQKEAHYQPAYATLGEIPVYLKP